MLVASAKKFSHFWQPKLLQSKIYGTLLIISLKASIRKGIEPLSFMDFLGASIFYKRLVGEGIPRKEHLRELITCSNLSLSEHAAHGIVCPALPASSTSWRQYHPPHASTAPLQNFSYSKTVSVKDFVARRYFLLQFYTDYELPSETLL